MPSCKVYSILSRLKQSIFIRLEQSVLTRLSILTRMKLATFTLTLQATTVKGQAPFFIDRQALTSINCNEGADITDQDEDARKIRYTRFKKYIESRLLAERGRNQKFKESKKSDWM